MAKGLYAIFRTADDLERHDRVVRLQGRQQLFDAIVITLKTEFGFGPGRFKKFYEKYQSVWEEICDLCNSDLKDDKEMIYSKAKIDDLLRQAVGDELFVPWEDRYDFK